MKISEKNTTDFDADEEFGMIQILTFQSLGKRHGMMGIFGQLRSAAGKLLGGQGESTQMAPPRPGQQAGRQILHNDTSASHLSLSSPLQLRVLTWFGAGVKVKVGLGSAEFHDLLAYFCSEAPSANAVEPAAINLQLPVADHAQPPVSRELPYWPRYDQLGPNQRRRYLDWMLAGRRNIPPELGYTFLFIYGLERRALVERQDIKLIFKEILRLRRLYAQSGEPMSRSFDGYTISFLWCLLLREPQAFEQRHFELLVASVVRWEEERLAAALCWLARTTQSLPPGLAYILASYLPKSQRSVVAQRVGDKLRELFLKRYQEQFGPGISLRCAKREHKFFYRPASAVLTPVEVGGPHPMGIISQFNPISDIWNGCIGDLKRLGGIIARSADGAITVDAWNAMPKELQDAVDHPLLDSFTRFIEEHTGDTPQTIVPARALATLAGISPDAKLTPATCRRMTETVERVGYCIEPDPRITLRGYQPDDSVVLFLNLGDGVVEPRRYVVASTMLNFGASLARVEGHLDEAHLSLLKRQIDSSFSLNEHEQRRLGMLLALRLVQSVELSYIAKPLKLLPATDREEIAKFALALVAASGLVAREARKSIRRLYSVMGFDRRLADAELSKLTMGQVAADEPVSVLPAVAGAMGELIPDVNEAPPNGIRLNRDSINAILRDTSEVAHMLAEAMHAEEADMPLGEDTTSTAISLPKDEVSATAILPAQYVPFFDTIVQKPQWLRTELTNIAKQHGLLLAGAIDAINDWSTESNGGPLLYEEGEHITLEPAYLEEKGHDGNAIAHS